MRETYSQYHVRFTPRSRILRLAIACSDPRRGLSKDRLCSNQFAWYTPSTMRANTPFDSSIRDAMLRCAILLIALLLLHISAVAAPPIVVITFDDLPDNVGVGDFYDGGFTVGGVYGPGPKLGISFGQGLSPITEKTNKAISPPNAIHTFGCCMAIDVPGGFTNGFSFFYTIGPSGPSTYKILDRNGNTLAESAFGNFEAPIFGSSSRRAVSGVSFAGTATSVQFGQGATNYLYDNLTFGSDIPNSKDAHKDHDETAKWFRKDAEVGEGHAQFQLAMAHDMGQGVHREYVQANPWFDLVSLTSWV